MDYCKYSTQLFLETKNLRNQEINRNKKLKHFQKINSNNIFIFLPKHKFN